MCSCLSPANQHLWEKEVSHIKLEHAANKDAEAARWKNLYRVASAAALVIAALIVVGAVSFMAWPPPEGSVTEWFALFQGNALLGMLDLDLVMLLVYIALIPVLLALYVALRRRSESLMVLATAFGLLAVATYLSSSRVFEMLAFSQQYAAATTEAQRTLLITAGQSTLTGYLGSFAIPAAGGWNYQSTAFNASYVLWSAAGIMLSVAMLRSGLFGKATSVIGIVGFTAAFGLFVPVVGILLSLVSMLAQLVWFPLIARTLFQLGWQRTHQATNEAMISYQAAVESK
jgi:hypothetical protein